MSHQEQYVHFIEREKIVRAAVEEACALYGLSLPRIEWSNRMTSSAGRASAKKLKFSIPLLLKAGTEECRETAIHEAAHYIDFCQRGTSDHGEEWLRIMETLGYPNAERCHTMDRTHVYKWTIVCGLCQTGLKHYTRRPSRLLRTHRSTCCHARLYIRPYATKEV